MASGNTYVIEFDEEEEEVAAEQGVPAYKIYANPSSIGVNQPFDIIVLAPSSFSVRWPYGGAAGRSSSPAETQTENISLGGALEIEASVPLASLVSVRPVTTLVDEDGDVYAGLWAGNLFSFSTVLGRLIAPKALWGTVAVEYRTYPAQIWRFSGLPAPGEYIAIASSSILNAPERLTISVTGDPVAAADAPALLTIQARNFRTDLPISGAAAYIDGVFVGYTDASGYLPAGVQVRGSHSIKLVASGYKSTDADELNNDSFTI
jgi:hypothetical protein